MPAYGTATSVPSISPVGYPLNQYLVFSAEAVVAGEYSQQVHLPPGVTAGQKGIRVVIDFSANPGNCEFEVMEADNDAAGSGDYVLVPTAGDITQANLVAGPNGASTRLVTDLIPFAGQFVCLYVKTKPSNAAITVTARLSRAA